MGVAEVAFAAIALAGATQTELQRRKAVRQADSAERKQQRLEMDYQNRASKDLADRSKVSAFQQRRAQQRASGAFGRSDTLLTGPQGYTPGDTQKKTLLGQ